MYFVLFLCVYLPSNSLTQSLPIMTQIGKNKTNPKDVGDFMDTTQNTISVTSKKVDKLQGIIERGKQRVASGIQSILSDYQLRKDYMVASKVMEFEPTEEGIWVKTPKQNYTFTDFSTNQVFEKAGIPKLFFQRMMSLKETALAKDVINRMVKRQNDTILIRTVNDKIKGFLSPSYKRIDASPIFELFVKKALEYGFVPYNACTTDYRYHIAYIYPDVREIGGDAVTYGLSITTSDYGSKAFELEFMILRISCSNLAIGKDILRKVHIGRRAGEMDSEMQILSQKTLELDSAAVQSQINDYIQFSVKNLLQLDEVVQKAITSEPNERHFDLIKKTFGKDVFTEAKSLYENGALTQELLPEGNSLWRLGNTLSLMANNSSGNNDKAIDLQKFAFEIMA